MRSHKYRVWDRKNKIMLKVTVVDFANGICFYCLRDKHLDFWNYDSELMQSTEIKDKNKIEVFEGDIVLCESGEYCQGFREYREEIIVDSILNWRTMSILSESEDLWIVGNIYENPDYVKGDKYERN